MSLRRKVKQKGCIARRSFLLGAAGCAGAAAWYWLRRQRPVQAELPPGEAQPAPPAPAEWRGVWVSYLEWAQFDFSSKEAFSTEAAQLVENCVGLGLNTLLLQLRPFGDALYRSALYPWSHLCTGTQGQDPGFDPLEIILRAAHERGLSVEGWLNPYRLRSSGALPPNLAPDNLIYTHPEWVCTVDEGVYLNPAEDAAAEYVRQGVEELVQNYALDGIHLDDYFYPTTDPALDAAQFAASGAADRDAWRRQKVTGLVQVVCRTVHAADPTLRFGISPQGNPDNDFAQQYSDAADWLAKGTVDYLCPQVYWGFGYRQMSGEDRFAFENITAEWMAYPKAEGTALYFGLGAYRIGEGDGSADPDSLAQWNSGSALAQQADWLRQQGAQGWALYRYGSLFAPAQSELAAAEREALRLANG